MRTDIRQAIEDLQADLKDQESLVVTDCTLTHYLRMAIAALQLAQGRIDRFQREQDHADEKLETVQS